MLVLRACGGRQRLVGTLSHHVRDALAVVAFLWLGGQATLLGMVIQTSTVITAAGDRGEKNRKHEQDLCFYLFLFIKRKTDSVVWNLQALCG